MLLTHPPAPSRKREGESDRPRHGRDGRLRRHVLHHRRLRLPDLESGPEPVPPPRHQPARRRAADGIAARPHQLAEPGARRLLGLDRDLRPGQGGAGTQVLLALLRGKPSPGLSRKREGRAVIIAVDGPTASGKGTIARALAERYRLPHLDTGLLYR